MEKWTWDGFVDQEGRRLENIDFDGDADALYLAPVLLTSRFKFKKGGKHKLRTVPLLGGAPHVTAKDVERLLQQARQAHGDATLATRGLSGVALRASSQWLRREPDAGADIEACHIADLDEINWALRRHAQRAELGDGAAKALSWLALALLQALVGCSFNLVHKERYKNARVLEQPCVFDAWLDEHILRRLKRAAARERMWSLGLHADRNGWLAWARVTAEEFAERARQRVLEKLTAWRLMRAVLRRAAAERLSAAARACVDGQLLPLLDAHMALYGALTDWNNRLIVGGDDQVVASDAHLSEFLLEQVQKRLIHRLKRAIGSDAERAEQLVLRSEEAAEHDEKPLNRWQQFQRDHKGQGMSREQLSALYQEQKAAGLI